MSQQRPVNLEIPTMRMTINMIASILHRIAGLGLFILLPFMVCLLGQSLESQESFNAIANGESAGVKVLLTVFLAGFAYHFVAGVKHLLLDWGVGESKKGSQVWSYICLFGAVILFAVFGVWIWV